MIHIKEVARQTGITVRTLRYYDQIGLLTAAAKTEGGHRLYTAEELRRLQYIQFLKGMGYKLQDIQRMLSDAAWNWSDSLNNQLAEILEEQERLRRIESSLRELIHGIAIEGGEEQPALHKLIQLFSRHKNRRVDGKEKLLDEKERMLWHKLPRMRGEDPGSLEWIALLGQITQYKDEDPAALPVQRIIRRMIEKQEEDFKGEEAFVNKLWEMRKSAKQSMRLGLYPVEKEVLDFLERAYDHYIASQPDVSSEQGGEHDS